MLALMRRMRWPCILTTAIEPRPSVAATAITVAEGRRRPRADGADIDLARIVLGEADTARRAGRWLNGVNYLNLSLCVILMLEILELHSPAFFLAPQAGLALALWFLADFLPVTLVFAGAQHLKHLKNLGLATAGACGMQYLAIQRGVVACLMLAMAPTLQFQSIPVGLLVLALGAAVAVNAVSALLALRLLARPRLRRAFR